MHCQWHAPLRPEKCVFVYPAVTLQDGRFVPNITIGPLVVDALRPVTELPLDVHLVRSWKPALNQSQSAG